GQTQTNGAHIRVWRRAEFVGAAAPHLRAGLELDMRLKTYDCFVIHSGFCLCQSVDCSYACAIRNSVPSPNGCPSNCKPIGSFGLVVNPHGTLIPQIPARLQEIVNISDRYICSGSSDFSQALNAGVGEVGVTNASTFSNAFRYSCRMSVRTFCARR